MLWKDMTKLGLTHFKYTVPEYASKSEIQEIIYKIVQ